MAIQQVFDTFKPQDAVDIASETTIWTPASGKTIRLMGGIVTVTGAAGNVLLRDDTSGPTIAVIPNAVIGTPIPLDFGSGIVLSAADNVLTADGPASSVLNGTFWGREE